MSYKCMSDILGQYEYAIMMHNFFKFWNFIKIIMSYVCGDGHVLLHC